MGLRPPELCYEVTAAMVQEGYLAGYAGADLHNFLTPVSSVSSGHFSA